MAGLQGMEPPIPNAVYLVELCSGELRRWRYRAIDGRGLAWWQDVDSGREFSETSLMYAWKVIGREPQEKAPR